MRSTFTAVLDANVLFPASLRDLLITLSAKGLYRARWTDEITDEWVRNALAKIDHLKKEHLQRTVELMENAIPDSNVTGYQVITPGLALPDLDDRHVLAAAIKCSAQVIVTYNLKDFPEEVLAEYDVEAKHPDEFLQDCYYVKQSVFIGGVKDILGRLKKPPQTAQELIETYRFKQGLALTAASLEDVIELLE